MTGWGACGRVLIMDTETTGVDVESDRIVTACASIVDGGESVYRRSWLVAVDVDIPEAASAVHGITTERARAEGLPAASVIPGIAGAVRYAVNHRMPVAIYNAPFDLTLLDRETTRWCGESLVEFCGGSIGAVLDPLVIDKAVDKYRPGSRKLTDTAALFGVVLGDNAHDADADVDAAGRLLWQMWLRSQLPANELLRLYGDRKFPDRLARGWQALGRMTLNELHSAQVGWYREQSESFAQYLRREGNERLHLADQAGQYDGDDGKAAALREEAEELFRRADGVRSEWPYTPVAAGAVTS